MAEMKTLNGHEIVDAKARKRLDTLEKEGVGGGESENLRILITKVDGGTGVSSHTAQAIYEADVAERVIEAVMDGYRYEYLGATHFTASGECDEVTFYRTMVENGKVMTEVVKIFDDGTATSETAEINPYSKDEVDQMVSAIPKFKVAVVTVHPTITEASLTTIYLVPSGDDDQNLYTEWICVEDDSGARTWEKLGTQNLDLTGYVTEEELNAAVEAALAEAKESGAFDGYSPEITLARYEAEGSTPGGLTVTVKKKDGTYSEQKVQDGANGASVAVSYVSESTESGGSNTVNFTDGKTLTVKNGKDGAQGATGPQGPAYTLTEDDKALIVAQVIQSLGGEPIFGYVDEDNNIIVQGDLAEGTYSVKYEMEDGSTVDIGNLVLDSNTYYSVTKNLTNCSISNSATAVSHGASYSATVTANSGYNLKSVTATMGGSAVTVTNGVISIASVTGNIVITAVAESSGPNNLANPSDTYWKDGHRLSIGSGSTSACEGHVVTNFIPAKMGDVLRVKGMNLTATVNNQDSKIVMYSAKDNEGSKLGGLYGTTTATDANGYGAKVTVNGDVSTITLLYSNAGVQSATSSMNYIRIDSVLLSGYTKNDVIITINEEIS